MGLEATFTDSSPTDNVVFLTMSATGIGTGYVSEWYFNLNDTYVPGYLSIVHQGGLMATSVSTGADSFKADGFPGKFDIKFDFPTSGDTFMNTETSTYKISYSGGILPGDFEFWTEDPITGYRFMAAAKLQGGASPNWVAAVPIPGAAWLLASGLIGLVVIRRVKR